MKNLYSKWQDIFSKRRLRLLIGLVPICVFIFSCNLWTLPADAATLCVNTGGTNGCYAMPSAAVTAAVAGDTILVHPGTYTEAETITINKAGLKIIGNNPQNTKIINPTFTVISVNASAEIAGLQLTGGGNGINVRGGNTASIILHHNHIIHNKGNGIDNSDYPFVAFNNTILSNNGHGVFGYGSCCSGPEIVYNNIIAHNTNKGIYDVGVASYNSSYGNGVADSGIGSQIGNISLDCLFVDEATQDYRLQPTSPCINTGDPGYFDVDGTRSDIGSFGGPGAALFWPYGNGGPVVTNLTVDPPYVPQGGTLSIKGTVEIR